MNKGSKGLVFAAGAIALAFGVVMTAALTPAQSAPAQAGTPKTAGETFKNIQVLKDIPADELIPSMEFISSSLGVHCSFCHEEGDFSKDTKHPKLRARQMITMQLAIDKENFNGRPEVTCYTCHRGLTHPVGVPVVGAQLAGAAPGEAMNSGHANVSTMLTADQVLAKYVEALGGMDAIQKITTRVEKGTMTDQGGHSSAITITYKAPDKRAVEIQTPRGEMTQAFDGSGAWQSMGGQAARPITGPELAGLRLASEFYFPAQAAQHYGQLRVGRPAKVNGADAYVLMGFGRGQAPVELYFDQQSGLLLREVIFAQTPLGRLPDQTDFSDYRQTDGVKVPYQMVSANPRGANTIRFDQVQQNVSVPDSKFAKPAAPAQNPPSQ
ncbi:MAG: c-type cytochrome [Terriglobia bacterium]